MLQTGRQAEPCWVPQQILSPTEKVQEAIRLAGEIINSDAQHSDVAALLHALRVDCSPRADASVAEVVHLSLPGPSGVPTYARDLSVEEINRYSLDQLAVNIWMAICLGVEKGELSRRTVHTFTD